MARPGHTRVGFQVPKVVVDQWDTWADLLGVSRTSFVITACAIGGKHLERAISPEKFVTAELVKALDESGVLDLSGHKAALAEVLEKEGA